VSLPQLAAGKPIGIDEVAVSHWLHPGIQAVFFDAVGTLLIPNPPASQVYAAIAREEGLSDTAMAIEQRFRVAFRAEEEVDRAGRWVTCEAREETRWRRIVQATLPRLADPDVGFRRLFAHFSHPNAWRVHPDAATVLPALREYGLKLGIASNFDRRLDPVVGGLDALAPARDLIVISSSVGFRKPAAEFFAAVVDVAGCRADAILFVGDHIENDYDGAAAAGLAAVLLDPEGRHPYVRRRVSTLSDLLA
jgi:putative hydrolase of the HAD superfamily